MAGVMLEHRVTRTGRCSCGSVLLNTSPELVAGHVERALVQEGYGPLKKLAAEIAYQKARAAYFKYVPEIENDPEGVQELVVEMRAARKAFLGKETP